MTAAIDPQGRCAAHPFVQLERQSKRTGEWVTLLDSCPLCDMDDSVPARMAPGEEKEDRERMPHEEEAGDVKDGGGRIGNRLRRIQRSLSFQGRVRSRRNERTSSVTSQRPRAKDSSLDSLRSYQSSRPRPKNASLDSRRSYQSIRSRRGADASPGGQGDARSHRSRERSTSQGHKPHPKDSSLESRRSLRSHSGRQSLHPSPHDTQEKSRRSSSTDIISNGDSGQDRVLPDPKEIESFNPQSDPMSQSSGGGQAQSPSDHEAIERGASYLTIKDLMQKDQAANQQPRQTDESLKLHAGSSSSGPPLARRNTVGGATSEQVSFPAPLSRRNSDGSDGQLFPPPPPPPPPPLELYTLALSKSVGSGGYRQPSMVVTRSGNEDSVSTLSQSLQIPPSAPKISERPSGRAAEEDDGEDRKTQEEEILWSMPIIDTAEFDSKGKCVRHPYIKLRKKKLMGGWKVLMSSCPDCCIYELNRIRCINDNKKRIKERRKRKEENDEDGGSRSRNASMPSLDSSCRSEPNRGSSRGFDYRSARGSPSGVPTTGHSPSSDNTRRMCSPSSDTTFAKLRPPCPTLEASVGTASLTGSSSSSLAARDEQPRQRWKRSIRVRGVRWVDPEDGQVGLYTGEANDRLVPHGWGEVEYHRGGTREGEWEDGWYRGKAPGSAPGLGARAALLLEAAGAAGGHRRKARTWSIG